MRQTAVSGVTKVFLNTKPAHPLLPQPVIFEGRDRHSHAAKIANVFLIITKR